MGRSGLTTLIRVICAGAFAHFLACGSAHATGDKLAFDIPAEDLGGALKSFGRTTRFQILFDGRSIRRKTSHAVIGQYGPSEALTVLLEGTGLTFSRTPDGVYLIANRPSPPPPLSPRAPDPEDAPSTVVVVTGIRASLQSSLSLKRAGVQVSDIITAEDIGKFPDKNLAESLQRITSVQITRFDGEGMAVSVRGADPSLVRTEIDETTVMSLSGGGTSRAVDFRNLPVEFASRLEVLKSATPEMSEGGLGGTVRVYMRKPFDTPKPLAMASIQGIYSSTAQTIDPKVTLLGSRLFLNDTLGVLLGVNYEDRHLYHDSALTTGWVRKVDLNGDDINDWTPDIPRPDMDRRHTKRAALNSVIQWKPSEGVEWLVEANYGRSQETDDLQLLQLVASAGVVDQTRTRLTATPDASGAYTTGHVELTSDPTHPMALSYRDVLGQNLMTQWDTSITGQWQATDRLLIDGKLSKSVGKIVTDERDAFATISALPRAVVDYNNSQGAPNVSFFDAAGQPLDVLSGALVDRIDAVHVFRPTNNEETDFKINADFKADLDWLSSVKIGVDLQETSLLAGAYSRMLTLTSNPALASAGGITVIQTNQSSLSGLVDTYGSTNQNPFAHDGDVGYEGGIRFWNELGLPVYRATLTTGGLSDDVFARNPNANTGDSYRLWPSNFEVTEVTSAFYAQAAFNVTALGYDISGIAGSRLVSTRTKSTGFDQVRDLDGTLSFPSLSKSGEYTNALPSVNVKVLFIPGKLIGRFSTGRVMARPAPSQLSYGRTLDVVGLAGAQGNPDLKPFLAVNTDIALEAYGNKDSLLTATLFEKAISRFIVNQTVGYTDPTGTTYRLTQPVNGTDRVTIRGLELSGQMAFSTLPSPLNGLGIVANATLQQDQGFKGINLISGEPLPFPGLSRTTYNASLYYENTKISARLSYNWRSRWLINASGRGGLPEFNEAYGTLDANIEYGLSEHVSALIDATNLTKSQYIQENDVQRRISNEINGSRIYFGLRFH
jgi:iron complex outermembrane receptor protein